MIGHRLFRPCRGNATRTGWSGPAWMGIWCILSAFGGVTSGPLPAAAAQDGISTAQFESFIFQQHGTAEQAKDYLATVLDLQIRRIDHSVTLDDDQERSLRLAGTGDIRRFFNHVVAAREGFQRLAPDKRDFRHASEIVSPLKLELNNGLFGGGSLFRKVVRRILSEEQWRRYRANEADRNQRRIDAHTRMFVAQLEATIPLTTDQREALLKLATVKGDVDSVNDGSFVILIGYRISTLPEERLEEIFDPAQMNALRMMKPRWQAGERTLRGQGVRLEEVLIEDAE